jgi:7,8-dihydro-6-hydroxymethylpterin-pyrophosphokinase
MRQRVEIPPPFLWQRAFVLTSHFQIGDALDRHVDNDAPATPERDPQLRDDDVALR